MSGEKISETLKKILIDNKHDSFIHKLIEKFYKSKVCLILYGAFIIYPSFFFTNISVSKYYNDSQIMMFLGVILNIFSFYISPALIGLIIRNFRRIKYSL